MKRHLLPFGAVWHRANLHSHTTVSDGALSPLEVKELYKSHGYSIVAFTDHDRIVEHRDLDDDGFLAIPGMECTIDIGGASPVCTEAANPRGRYYHLNILATRRGADAGPLRDTIWGGQRRISGGDMEDRAALASFSYGKVNDFIAKCNELGFLVQLNHPFWSENVREDWLSLEGLWALEILNWATHRLTLAEYCPLVYEDMLRKRGPSLRCVMDDDNHNPPERTVSDSSFGGSVFVASDDLSLDAVGAALRRGDFYSASGGNPPRITALWLEGRTVHAEFTPASLAIYEGSDRRHHQTRADRSMTSAEFHVPDGERYFRLVVADSAGNAAHTSAYDSGVA